MDIKLVESIKQLIAEGKTENAITQFLDNIDDDTLKNDLIIISGKFQKIKREQNIGIEHYDKISQEKNKINNSLLEILNSIKIENITQENESDELKKLKIKIQEKINGLYAIDTEYWGEVIKIDENTLVITYNPYKYSREGIITFVQYIYVLRLNLWSFIQRIPLYLIAFMINGYLILVHSLGYDLSNIQHDCFYIFGFFCLFAVCFELILRMTLGKSRTFETTDEIKIDLNTGIIMKSRIDRRNRALFLPEKTLSTKNQIQYLDKCHGIGVIGSHMGFYFDKGKDLSIGFLKYNVEAIIDFVELIELVSNYFSSHSTIKAEAYYGKDHPHNSSLKNTPV